MKHVSKKWLQSPGFLLLLKTARKASLTAFKNYGILVEPKEVTATHRVSVWEEEELQFLHDIMCVHCKVILDLTHADILLQLLVHIIPALTGQRLSILHSHVSNHGVLQDIVFTKAQSYCRSAVYYLCCLFDLELVISNKPA